MEALRWLAFSKRPLTADELRDVLSVKEGQKNRETEFQPSIQVILECCQGLVLMDQESSLRLAHYTVQEYLVSAAATLFPTAHRSMSLTCLTYLMMDEFQSGPLDDSSAIDRRFTEYPFLSYAACHWYTHARKVEGCNDLDARTLEFLRSPHLRAAATQANYSCYGYNWNYCQPGECLSDTALHFACWGGLEKIVYQLLCEEEVNVNLQTLIGTTPILSAAGAGHEKIVQMLLDYKADPYIENWYGNALHCAAEAGRCAVIRLLVSHGMSPSTQGRDGAMPVIARWTETVSMRF